ncbi:MAG TPA: hypothetical protein PKN52_04450 [Trueperaceae bacterium]|nr:hypothetical protein [Trueperaceae bacterium]
MARNIHARYVRRRSWDRLRRSKNFIDFLTAQAERLKATGALLQFTANSLNGQLTATAHGLVTGAGPILLSNVGGALPLGLVADTPYWVKVVDENTIVLYPTDEDARAGTNPSGFTDNGTGTHSLQRSADAEALFEQYLVAKGKSAEQLLAETDIDDII